jgi:hypothetical protein
MMTQEIGILQTIVSDLEKRLNDQVLQLQRLNGEIRAWKDKAHAHCPACGNKSFKTRPNVPFFDLPLSEAVMVCLSEYDYPISSRTLRLKLEEKGYPKEKLGRYGNKLHTAIWRLIESGRIQRQEGDELIAIR